MTYCPPNNTVQTYEFSALTGADVLQGSDTELSCGDCFTMPVSATACVEVTDNDGSLSGDAYNNEWGDDHSWQIADIKVGGELVHDDQKIYAEEYYVLHDQHGNCFYMIEIEVVGAGSDLDDYYAFVGDVPPAGADLTVVGKGNVCGNWIDYRDLSAGLKWDFDEEGKLTVEAEDMALRGYKVDDVHAASGGEVIRLKKAEGTASLTFGGETATYDLELAYIDENDGEGSIEIWVNGVMVHEIDLTNNNNGNGGDWSTISKVKVEDILISQGDVIELRGTRDCWEFARIDALTFCEKPVAQNEPPVAVDDAFTVDETSSTILDILGNDFDPDGDTISLVSFTQPAEGSVRVDENGQVIFETGTDFAGLIDGQTATVSFQYQIADEAGLQSEATVTVTVIGEGACPPPVRFTDLATLPSGQDYTVNFDAPLELCGEDPDFSLSVNFGDVATEQYNFVYVIDVSTSTGVADSFAAGQTVLEAEVEALKALTADILDIGIPADAVTVTIIPFSSTDSTQPGLFQAKTFGGAGNEALDQAGVDTFLDALTPGGETDYLAAIGATTQSVQTLEAAFGDANNQVYFLSDGNPTPPGSQPPFLIELFSQTLQAQASVHAVGLGVGVSPAFLDPLDNTGGAEIVTDPATLAASLGQAPFEASTILGATLTFTDDTGALIDSLDFTASDFSETPLGYELDIASVAGLGIFAGQTTTAQLEVRLDEDGDLVADDTLLFDVDMVGQAPESLDI